MAVRRWDLASATSSEKVGFWADIGGYFFIFGIGGGAQVGPCIGALRLSGDTSR